MHNRLKTIREALGLSKKDFAARVDVAPSSVTHWERGEIKPSNARKYLICKEFGVSREWLESGAGEMFDARKRAEQEELNIVAQFFESLNEDQQNYLLNAIKEKLKDPSARASNDSNKGGDDGRRRL